VLVVAWSLLVLVGGCVASILEAGGADLRGALVDVLGVMLLLSVDVHLSLMLFGHLSGGALSQGKLAGLTAHDIAALAGRSRGACCIWVLLLIGCDIPCGHLRLLPCLGTAHDLYLLLALLQMHRSAYCVACSLPDDLFRNDLEHLDLQ